MYIIHSQWGLLCMGYFFKENIKLFFVFVYEITIQKKKKVIKYFMW